MSWFRRYCCRIRALNINFSIFCVLLYHTSLSEVLVSVNNTCFPCPPDSPVNLMHRKTPKQCYVFHCRHIFLSLHSKHMNRWNLSGCGASKWTTVNGSCKGLPMPFHTGLVEIPVSLDEIHWIHTISLKEIGKMTSSSTSSTPSYVYKRASRGQLAFRRDTFNI